MITGLLIALELSLAVVALAQEKEEPEESSFWKKMEFSIGVGRNAYWGGGDLKSSTHFMDIGAFFSWWYGFNSVRASASYPMNEESAIEIGVKWGKVKLCDRIGLRRYIPPEEFGDTVYNADGRIKTSDWELVISEMSIGIVKHSFSWKAYFSLCKASTREYLYSPMNPLDNAWVERWCGGAGLSFSYFPPWRLLGGWIKPYVGVQLGLAEEYKNDAPWQWDWKDRLSVGLSGICFGTNIRIGGVK